MTTGVPVFDLSAYASATPADRSATARAVDEANRSVGFLIIVGHTVPDAVITDARGVARTFFDQPIETKLDVAMPEPGYPYGYTPMMGEALHRSVGGHSMPDLKETFSIGPIGPPPRPLHEMSDEYERAVYAPNLWPEGMVEFRASLESYYEVMSRLARELLELFAAALELPSGWFDPFVNQHGSALRLAHYPALPGPPLPGQFRAGAHTDYGTLTILAVDDEPGLQVETSTGEWIDVECPSGGLVVNLGDLMQRWTNDRWRSTSHRVTVSQGGRSRLTMPFFHNANWDAVIAPIVTPGEIPRHDVTTAGRHLMDKFRSTVV